MQPFGITAQGDLDELEARLSDAAQAVADHAEADDETRAELHALAEIGREVAASSGFGDGAQEFTVSVTGATGPSSSTSGGVDTIGVSVTCTLRHTGDQGGGQPTGQVDPATVGAPDSPPATPNQN